MDIKTKPFVLVGVAGADVRLEFADNGLNVDVPASLTEKEISYILGVTVFTLDTFSESLKKSIGEDAVQRIEEKFQASLVNKK